jgi:hypothetical protein
MIADEGLTCLPGQHKLHRLARSFDFWHDELLAYFDPTPPAAAMRRRLARS